MPRTARALQDRASQPSGDPWGAIRGAVHSAPMPEPSATPPPESAAPGAADAASAPMIDAPLSCVRCDYDLRGLPIEGRCPECGVPVEVSQRERRRLADAAVPYVNTLYAGAWLVVIAIVLGVLAVAEYFFGAAILTWILPTASPVAWDAVFVGIAISAILTGALGWWWLAAPNPDGAENRPMKHDRRMVRITAAPTGVMLTLLLIAAASPPGAIGWMPPIVVAFLPWMVVVGCVLALILGLLLFFSSMSYAARLGLRTGDTGLFNSARRLMRFGPWLCTVGLVTVIGPLAVALILTVHLFNLRAHLSAVRAGRSREFGD